MSATASSAFFHSLEPPRFGVVGTACDLQQVEFEKLRAQMRCALLGIVVAVVVLVLDSIPYTDTCREHACLTTATPAVCLDIRTTPAMILTRSSLGLCPVAGLVCRWSLLSLIPNKSRVYLIERGLKPKGQIKEAAPFSPFCCFGDQHDGAPRAHKRRAAAAQGWAVVVLPAADRRQDAVSGRS